MARMSPIFRIFMASVAILFMAGNLTACSKDEKKGTPVTDRNTVAATSDPEQEVEMRVPVEDEGEKATRPNPSDLDSRGEDIGSKGPQIDSEGLQADVSQQKRVETAFQSEVRITPADQIYVSSDYSAADNTGFNFGMGGEIGKGVWLNLDYVGLEALAPDEETLYIRANKRNYRPIATLGTDDDERPRFDFTDYSDDLLMNTVLRLSMKTSNESGYSDIRAGDNDFLPQEFFDDSREFAGYIKDIRTKVTATGSVNRPASIAGVTVTYTEDQGKTYKTLELRGSVNQRTRQAALRQVGGNSEHLFQGYLTCLDVLNAPGGQCTNSVIVIEQVLHGKICKRVFAVVRHTHVALSIDRADYRNYFNESNIQKRSFLQYLSNTVAVSRYSEGYYIPEDGDDLLLTLTGHVDVLGRPIVTLPTPFLEQITTRTFAVAHGFAESELEMVESGYERQSAGELSIPAVKDSFKDVFRVVSPLARAIPGNNVSALGEVDGSTRGGLNMHQLVSSAEVVGNDGRGTMEVKYNFGGDSLMVVYKADNVEMNDPRNIKLYPYQGKVAPENITPEMMPLPF